ncbi:hypothetical protein [Actinokineospora enzanensis]|uniref:hypothetical protein n=1 Tax=Actinokineospora enzanensis TaxID=155975 RepID=UPI0012EC2BAB|nr:hypothetical protein [Actinokineospora enzanensis]
MINPARTPELEAEIERVANLARELMRAYVSWGSQKKTGETHLATHGDVIDFVNFRMETADSCLKLIEADRIGDALGLCRSLLEHYLLFILICRGDKYFKVWDLSNKTPAEFAEFFNERKRAWEQERADGKTDCVDFRKHPRAARHVMLVYDGIRFEDGEKLPVSMYYFHFEQFRPEIMRLDEADYFEYYERPADLKKAMKGHRQEAHLKYRHFLGYDALVMCLELNGLIDEAVRHRLEAHYTFLGTFLHPTNNAVRDLHERSNWHSGTPMIGMEYDYTQTSRLLAYSYVCYLLAGILDELATLFESSPKKYIADPATAALRAATSAVPATVPYFWFLFNEAPLYDKFNWAIHHATDEQLKEFGGYAGVPSDLIPFNQHIYESLGQGLGGWSNVRVGQYISPVLGRSH